MTLKERVRTKTKIQCTLSFLGVMLSVYTYYVEHNLAENPDAVAMCDINEHMSCTKAFSSDYGKGFGFLWRFVGKDSILNVPNSIPGVIFYLAYFLLSFSMARRQALILVCMSVASMFMSAYLAYVLIFILKDICVVCFAIHLINSILLPTSIFKWKTISNHKTKIKKK